MTKSWRIPVPGMPPHGVGQSGDIEPGALGGEFERREGDVVDPAASAHAAATVLHVDDGFFAEVEPVPGEVEGRAKTLSQIGQHGEKEIARGVEVFGVDVDVVEGDHNRPGPCVIRWSLALGDGCSATSAVSERV